MSHSNEVKKLIRHYAREGWIIEKGKRHSYWRLPGRADFVTVSISPSDFHAFDKIRADLRRYAGRQEQH